VEDGISTVVYRLLRSEEVYYLRVLPEVDDSFAPEAYVHTLLRQGEVCVPQVVHFEHCNQSLHRSVMVTTEIRGQHVGHLPFGEVSANVFIQAGRDLAIINSVRVEGIRRVIEGSNCRSRQAHTP
jgi:hypothetical protein